MLPYALFCTFFYCIFVLVINFRLNSRSYKKEPVHSHEFLMLTSKQMNENKNHTELLEIFCLDASIFIRHWICLFMHHFLFVAFLFFPVSAQLFCSFIHLPDQNLRKLRRPVSKSEEKAERLLKRRRIVDYNKLWQSMTKSLAFLLGEWVSIFRSLSSATVL